MTTWDSLKRVSRVKTRRNAIVLRTAAAKEPAHIGRGERGTTPHTTKWLAVSRPSGFPSEKTINQNRREQNSKRVFAHLLRIPDL